MQVEARTPDSDAEQAADAANSRKAAFISIDWA